MIRAKGALTWNVIKGLTAKTELLLIVIGIKVNRHGMQDRQKKIIVLLN